MSEIVKVTDPPSSSLAGIRSGAQTKDALGLENFATEYFCCTNAFQRLEKMGILTTKPSELDLFNMIAESMEKARGDVKARILTGTELRDIFKTMKKEDYEKFQSIVSEMENTRRDWTEVTESSGSATGHGKKPLDASLGASLSDHIDHLVRKWVARLFDKQKGTVETVEKPDVLTQRGTRLEHAPEPRLERGNRAIEIPRFGQSAIELENGPVQNVMYIGRSGGEMERYVQSEIVQDDHVPPVINVDRFGRQLPRIGQSEIEEWENNRVRNVDRIGGETQRLIQPFGIENVNNGEVGITISRGNSFDNSSPNHDPEDGSASWYEMYQRRAIQVTPTWGPALRCLLGILLVISDIPMIVLRKMDSCFQAMGKKIVDSFDRWGFPFTTL